MAERLTEVHPAERQAETLIERLRDLEVVAETVDGLGWAHICGGGVHELHHHWMEQALAFVTESWTRLHAAAAGPGAAPVDVTTMAKDKLLHTASAEEAENMLRASARIRRLLDWRQTAG